jgi:hypothetical protein
MERGSAGLRRRGEDPEDVTTVQYSTSVVGGGLVRWSGRGLRMLWRVGARVR